MEKIFGIMALVMAIIIKFNGLGLAESRKATFMVYATVVARVSQSIIHQESRINITEEDIKRGFVEIPSGTILHVRSNNRKGYLLHFQGGNEFIKEVWVMDKGRTVVVSSNGGFIYQPYSGTNFEVKDLSYKLHLRENIQPGTYSFPFRVRASLL